MSIRSILVQRSGERSHWRVTRAVPGVPRRGEPHHGRCGARKEPATEKPNYSQRTFELFHIQFFSGKKNKMYVNTGTYHKSEEKYLFFATFHLLHLRRPKNITQHLEFANCAETA